MTSSAAADPIRFHLTLSTTEHPGMHGWWPKEVTAQGKFREWIGAYSKMPAARVTLTVRAGASERLLESWPNVS
ncbi:hypothetical protein [Streptomyces gibsoniae]|uniref:Uncharacterized protein n=1 Tax=Streptomyces gibsoniae TaxID=3075529 RepID=A0ABU2U962_9ACTN|nr:hypothetical protein [Streptomyces sp. DSM 41699]MDT0469774.1 hypothetical protein [Streptomyces sp. DSM 41699]